MLRPEMPLQAGAFKFDNAGMRRHGLPNRKLHATLFAWGLVAAAFVAAAGNASANAPRVTSGAVELRPTTPRLDAPYQVASAPSASTPRRHASRLASAGQVATSCAGSVVGVGEDLQRAIESTGEGGTVCIGPGVHRLTMPLQPKFGQHFVGLPGAVLDGSLLLSNFTADGSRWTTPLPFRPGAAVGQCRSGAGEACRYANDVFVDDQFQRRAPDASHVTTGTFFIDPTSNRLVLGRDPRGHRVEASVVTHAIVGERGGSIRQPDNVVVENLIIQKFATPAQSGGAIGPGYRSGWTLDQLEARWNHSVGIQVGPHTIVRDSYVHDNGQEGLAGHGQRTLIEHNEITFNNVLGFDPRWEAGGAKFVRTDGLVVRANSIHNNNGPGLWSDGYNRNLLIEQNTITNNEYEGVFHEIGYAATIRDNVIEGNGLTHPSSNYSAGILIAASSNVTVTGNTIRNNANGVTLVQENRGDGPYGPLQLHDNHIYRNTIDMSMGRTGLFQYVNDNSYYLTRHNTFAENHYQLRNGANHFYWMNVTVGPTDWTYYGNDTTNATFTRL
jgi:putative cofactor-binding repeat protein